MDIDPHTNRNRLVEDGLEDLDFLGRPWFGGVSAISRVCLMPLAGMARTAARASSGVPSQIDAFRRDNPRAVDHSRLNVIAQSQITVTRAPARQDRRVAGLEQRLHQPFLVGPGINVRVGIIPSEDHANHRGRRLRQGVPLEDCLPISLPHLYRIFTAPKYSGIRRCAEEYARN